MRLSPFSKPGTHFWSLTSLEAMAVSLKTAYLLTPAFDYKPAPSLKRQEVFPVTSGKKVRDKCSMTTQTPQCLHTTRWFWLGTVAGLQLTALCSRYPHWPLQGSEGELHPLRGTVIELTWRSVPHEGRALHSAKVGSKRSPQSGYSALTLSFNKIQR